MNNVKWEMRGTRMSVETYSELINIELEEGGIGMLGSESLIGRGDFLARSAPDMAKKNQKKIE
jgi:hypothetical protein